MPSIVTMLVLLSGFHFPPQIAGQYVTVRKTYDNQLVTVWINVQPYDNQLELRPFKPDPPLPGPRDYRFSYNRMEQRQSSQWIAQVNNWIEIPIETAVQQAAAMQEPRLLFIAVIDGKIFEPRNGVYHGVNGTWNSNDPNTVSEVDYDLACKLFSAR